MELTSVSEWMAFWIPAFSRNDDMGQTVIDATADSKKERRPDAIETPSH